MPITVTYEVAEEVTHHVTVPLSDETIAAHQADATAAGHPPTPEGVAAWLAEDNDQPLIIDHLGTERCAFVAVTERSIAVQSVSATG